MSVAREKTIRMHDNLSGQTLNGRYALEEKLGAGGFAAVYRARDRRLNRHVAVKVLNEARSANLRDIDRFRNEAGISAQIDDEHIVRVYDFGEDAGYIYFVMELLRGECLRYRMKNQEPWPWRRACEIVEKLCVAVERAHEHNVAHRDIKPENLFLEVRRGREMIKLLDLGIAKVLTEAQWNWLAQNLSASDGFIGSPSYMAPEQAQGPRFCDLRVDVYAVGIVFYEMLTGDVPFRGHTAWETMLMHAQRAPLAPTMRVPEAEIPPEVEAICLRAISKLPGERFPTIGAMAAAINEVLAQRAPSAARAAAGDAAAQARGEGSRVGLSVPDGVALASTEPAFSATPPREACVFAPLHPPVAVPVQDASCLAETGGGVGVTDTSRDGVAHGPRAPARPASAPAASGGATPWMYTPPLRWRTRFFLAYLMMGSTTASCAISTLLTFAMEPDYLERLAEQRRAHVQMIDTSRSSRSSRAPEPARPAPPARAVEAVNPVLSEPAPDPQVARKKVAEAPVKRRGEAPAPRRATMSTIARRAAATVKDACKITPFSPLTEAAVELVFTVDPANGAVEKVTAVGEPPPLRQPDCVRDRARAVIDSFAGASDLRREYRHSYTVLR